MMTASATALAIEAPEDPSTTAEARQVPRRTEIITFRRGLLGFSDCTRYALLRTERPGFFWLQSVEHEPLAFLLVDPFHFFADYTVDLEAAEVAGLQATTPADLAVLAIVTLPREPGEACTANLQGPIVINLRSGQGLQVILTSPELGVRCPIDLART